MTADLSYSHHRPYTKASEISPVPYLGPPETALRVAYRKAYSTTSTRFRSEKFLMDLAAALDAPNTEDALMWLMDLYVGGANDDYHQALLQILNPVAATGALMAQNQALAATTAMIKESQPQRRRRRITYPTRLPRPGERLWIPNYPSDLRVQPTLPTPEMSSRQRRRLQLKYGLPSALNPRRGLGNPYHLASAADLPLHLITRINNAQRTAIRTAVTDTIKHSWNPEKTAMIIANIVGLDPRWQRAVANAHARWIANGTPVRIANQRAQDYADELREKRGTMIAKTELMRAYNYGRLDGWHAQADAGLFSATESVKEWVSSPLESGRSSPCEMCAELGDWHGDGHGYYVRGIDGQFPTEWGNISAPPAHPNCRCTTVLWPNGVSEKMSKAWPRDDVSVPRDHLNILRVMGDER
jgi:hypothetical protein